MKASLQEQYDSLLDRLVMIVQQYMEGSVVISRAGIAPDSIRGLYIWVTVSPLRGIWVRVLAMCDVC